MDEKTEKTQVTETTLLGKTVIFTSDSAWSGVPAGRYIKEESGEIMSIYLDPGRGSLPTYTVRLHDGLLIEACAYHFRVV